MSHSAGKCIKIISLAFYREWNRSRKLDDLQGGRRVKGRIWSTALLFPRPMTASHDDAEADKRVVLPL